jgi:hypothetical protein
MMAIHVPQRSFPVTVNNVYRITCDIRADKNYLKGIKLGGFGLALAGIFKPEIFNLKFGLTSLVFEYEQIQKIKGYVCID